MAPPGQQPTLKHSNFDKAGTLTKPATFSSFHLPPFLNLIKTLLKALLGNLVMFSYNMPRSSFSVVFLVHVGTNSDYFIPARKVLPPLFFFTLHPQLS